MVKIITRKLIRSILLTVFLLCLFLIFGVPRLIHYVIGPQTMVAWLSDELSQRLGRQILIDNVTVNLWEGLDLWNVRVSEYPTFREGTLIQARHFVLRPSISDLLTGYIVIREVYLDGAMFRIARSGSGNWNLSSLVTKSSAPPSMAIGVQDPAAAKVIPIDLGIQDIRINDSQFILMDAMQKIPSIQADQITATISGFSMIRPFKIEIRFNLTSSSNSFISQFGSVFKIEARARLDLARGDWQRLKAGLEDFRIEAGSWALQSSGTIKSVKPFMADMKANMQFDQFSLPLSSSSLDLDGKAQTAVQLEFVNGASAVDERSGSQDLPAMPHFQSSTVTFNVFMAADHLKASFGNFLAKPASTPLKLKLEGSYVLNSQNIGGENFKGHELQGKGFLEFTKPPQAHVDQWKLRWGRQPTQKPAKPRRNKEAWEIVLSSGSFPFEGVSQIFYPERKELFGKGTMGWRELAAASLDNGWHVNVEGARLSQSAVQYQGQKVDSLDVFLESGKFRKQGHVFETVFKGALEVRGAETRFLSCRELMASVDMAGIGKTFDSNIRGEIHASLNSGALKEIPSLVEHLSFMRFLITPLTIIEDLHNWKILKLENHDFKAMAMDTLRADYYFGEGKMSMESVKLQGPVGAVEVRGSINFPLDSVNILVTVNVPKGKTPFPMAEALSDSKGNPYFSVKIKGSLGKPEVYTIPVAKKDMLANNIEKQFGDLKKKVQEALGTLFR